MGTDHLARFAYTAAADASACIARLNADPLRHLQSSWLDRARFPTSVKEAVKRDPLPLGVTPTQEHVEFTAPIVGDTLPGCMPPRSEKAKSEQVLSKKAAALKPPRVKRRPQSGPKGTPSAKRQRESGQQSTGKDQQGSRRRQCLGQHSLKGKGNGKNKGKGPGKGPSGDKPPKDS